MARVLGRVRLSRSTDESTSEDRQREAIETWCRLHGHTVVGWAVDLDVSGAVSPFDTPELGAWLRNPGRWDVVAAWKLDRLGRTLFALNDLFAWCQREGKTVACIEDQIDLSTWTGRLVAAVIAGVAEGELEAIRSRTSASQAALRERGRWHGGTVPFGYRKQALPDGGGFVLAPDETEAPILRDLFARAAERASVSSLAADLNKRGVPTRRGGKWTSQTVTRMLRSRWPIGQAEHMGRVVLGDDGMPMQRSEPVIDFGVWSLVQAVMDDRSRPRKRTNPPGWLLNVAFCGECGEPFYHHVMNKLDRSQQYRYWRCSGRTRKSNGCQSAGIPAKTLEEFAEGALLDEIGHLERTEHVYVPAQGHASEIAKIDEAITRLRKEADRGLIDVSDDEYLDRLTALTGQRKSLAQRPSRPAGWERKSTGETYSEAWHSAMDEVSRRELLLEAGVRITAELKGGVVPIFGFHVDVPKLRGAVPTYSVPGDAGEIRDTESPSSVPGQQLRPRVG